MISKLTHKTCRDVIKSGQCKADCCGVIPIEKEIYNKHKNKLWYKVFLLLPGFKKEYYTITTFKGTCPFLNKKYDCMIYEDRPPVCRLYASGLNHKYLQCPYGIKNKENT